MFFIDFIKKIFVPHRLGALVYIVLNIIILYAAISPDSVGMLFVIFAAYFASMFVLLSPVGEFVFRIYNLAFKIRKQEILDIVEPIFKEVYEKALEESPQIGRKIRLYMIDTNYINAFALGRNTIMITEGAIDELSDETIKGLFAHEFGHIANRDTDFVMLSIMGNLFLLPVFIILYIMGIVTTFLVGIVGINLGAFFVWLFNTPAKIWVYFGSLLILSSSQVSEFIADKYAADLGYKNGLLDFLHLNNQFEGRMGVLQKLESTHPPVISRIEQLSA